MKSAEDRYLEDPAFRILVDLIISFIHQKQYTASEVRDAAMLAAIKYEQMNMRRLWVYDGVGNPNV